MILPTLEQRYEMLPYLKQRELALIVPSWCSQEERKKSIRTLKVNNVQQLNFILSRLKAEDKTYNIYYSLAKYINGIPNQDLNHLHERDSSKWKENHYKEMVSYDLLIDIDSPTHKDLTMCHKEAIKVKAYLDSLSLPHEVRFSGCGFHFLVPYKYLPQQLSLNPHDKYNIYLWCYNTVKIIYEECSEYIDLGIYDSRRVCKIPYTTSIYSNESYIAYPFLTNTEFIKWRLGNKPSNIRQRGTYLFNANGNSF